jgi:hypothetical protein
LPQLAVNLWRAPEEIEELAGAFAGYVEKNPGQRIEQVARGIGVTTKDLKFPTKKVLEAGSVKAKGQRRSRSSIARCTSRASRMTRDRLVAAVETAIEWLTAQSPAYSVTKLQFGDKEETFSQVGILCRIQAREMTFPEGAIVCTKHVCSCLSDLM